ncbi:cytochrome b [Legionella londiniensis]|uniref:Cytochrome b-561 transmembrane protein n=1 Tax=Legionella londiniensis TaxID=45068 RepID=A0A0W0VM23_9GAMM|nr:cytochrome b [Legionella londiniensis]KTD21153.1 cytochrome b-561 transmembrane protein [Legionella londiniensis]STX93175.1 cybB cytochrome b-561 transmembrane protein [Legionella londiniensis]
MKKNAVVRYSTGSKILHWLIAVIVIIMLSVSFFLEELPKQYQPTAFFIHKSFGLTVLFLMVIRLFWISYAGKPDLPLTVPFWQKTLARSVQFILYLFLFAMPISGWIMSVAANKPPSFFGLFQANLPIEPNKALAQFMNQLHELFAWILIVLIALHLAGALKHYFIDKDKVLQSMLPERH